MDEIKKLKTENDFKDLYESKYYEVIDNYYDEIKKEHFKEILKNIGILFIAIVLFFVLSEVFSLPEKIGYYNLITVIYLVLAVYITITSIIEDKKNLVSEVRKKVMKDMLAFIVSDDANNVVYDQKMQVSKESFNKAELFNLELKNIRYKGANYARFKYNKNTIVFSDIDIYLRIRKNEDKMFRKKKKTIFNGIYVGASFNKKNTNQLYLIPNNFKDTFLQSKIMHYIKFNGYNVKLENLEFSKKYKVFCDDEVQARYILSLSLMEKINNLDKVFPTKKYIVFKQGRRFCICIENSTIEKAMDNLFGLFRHKRNEYKKLEKLYKYLYDLINIYNFLDLGNDLYVKHMQKEKALPNTNKATVTKTTNNIQQKVKKEKPIERKLSKEEFLDN